MKAHFFSRESVHLVDPRDGSVARRHFHCRRCSRTLPDDQFGQVGSIWRGMRYVVALHPFCWKCREQLKGEWASHPLYTPALDRFWDGRFQQLRAGARSREIFVGIEKDDVLGLFLKQEGKCALSGVPLDYRSRGGGPLRKRAIYAPSVDRIDSSGNYVLNNIQIVAEIVNIMKSTLSSSEFLKWCSLIVGHAGRKQAKREDELLSAIAKSGN